MRLRIVFLIAFLTGCAPAGEWADDPRNFTREEVLFFQFRANSAFRDRFIQSNAFVPVAPAAVFSRGYCRTTPSWFLPGAPSRYRAWSVPPHSTREGSPPFIAEDLNTGVLFVYACQI